ncbi:UNVERIFIED_CONTAM: hypothetical protein K2H54_045540 [Gekko kuhli]
MGALDPPPCPGAKRGPPCHRTVVAADVLARPVHSGILAKRDRQTRWLPPATLGPQRLCWRSPMLAEGWGREGLGLPGPPSAERTGAGEDEVARVVLWGPGFACLPPHPSEASRAGPGSATGQRAATRPTVTRVTAECHQTP